MGLLALAEEAPTPVAARMQYAEAQARRLCQERGLDWDCMSEEERKMFFDDLVHEDRQCEW